MSLSRAEIDAAIEAAQPSTRSVPVPELGGSVVVKEMSGSLRNAFEAAVAAVQAGGSSKALDGIIIRLVSECTLDEDGKVLLDPDRTRRLFHRKPRAVFRLRDEIIGLSAMSEDDLEAMTEVFGDDPSEDSTSG